MTSLSDLRSLLEEATPGPWLQSGPAIEAVEKIDGTAGGKSVYFFAIGGMEGEADAALIIAAVNALPALLDLWEATRAFDSAWREGPKSQLGPSKMLATRSAMVEALNRLEQP